MKYYSLILTNKFNKVNKDENLLSTKICKDFLNVNDLSKDYKFNNISRKEILKRYGFCEKIYKKLIIDLKKELNRVHNLNYSVRSWDIIIGRWLRDFIQISYKSYLELTYVLKNYKVNKFYIFDKKKFSLNVNDTISQEIASADQQWAYCLSSLLIESIKPNGKFITISPKNYSFELKKNYKISFASIFNSKLIFKIINFSKLLINYNNYALITKTYLPFKSEKLLEIKFRQIPLMWPEISIKYNKKNELLRNSLKLKKRTKNPFEKFLRFNIHNFLPKFILENFKEIKKISESNIYPRNPKFIFTSISYAYDEVFKFYVANKIKKKIPYYVGQHGGNYFNKIHNNYLSELYNSDNFISWGAKNKPFIKKGFNFLTLNKKITHKKKGKLLIIFDYISQMTFDLHNTNQAMLNHIKNMRDVILELNPEVRKNVILRLNRSFYENFYGIKYYNFFKDLNVQIDNGEKKISNLIKEARLTLFNYDSTGILENFIHNVPTVFFCEKNFFNTLNRNYVIKYKYLFKNNVIFLDKTKIKNHLNNNWDNISDLWFSSKNQKMLKTFNKNYNVKPNLGDINKIKKILLSKTQ